MPNTPVQAAAEGLPKLSRRHLLKGAVAAAALAAPVAGEAQASLSDEEQLNECVASLRTILERMHPGVSVIHPHYLSSRQDGSFRFWMQGDVVHHGTYDGPGLYEISMDGYLMTFWLEEKHYYRKSTGEVIPHMSYYEATQWYEGKPVDDVRKFFMPQITRKLAEVSL